MIYMLWSDLFDAECEPLNEQIIAFVETPLWSDLSNHLQQTYGVKPILSYSNCAMGKGLWKGWNVKYKKAGKALCSLYPKQGYFTALINVGSKEAAAVQAFLPNSNAYTRALYEQTKTGASGKSLAMKVTNASILQDVKELINFRMIYR